jgi:hypothetical protein
MIYMEMTVRGEQMVAKDGFFCYNGEQTVWKEIIYHDFF